jgi:F0F1-type ATP synthase delta subunit
MLNKETEAEINKLVQKKLFELLHPEDYAIKEEKITATVIFSIEVSDAIKNKVQQILSSFCGYTPEIEWNYDENILGGILIKIGDKIFDYTLKNQLRLLKSQIIYEMDGVHT